MATSYASQHKQAIQSARLGHTVSGACAGLSPAGNEYRAQFVKLETDKSRLSAIRSIQRKTEIKRGLLPSYADHIQLVINQDSGLQDDILVTVLIWSIDVGDYSNALKMADYALKHNLKPPENFTRNLAEVITEEISTQVFRADNPECFIDWLQQLEALTRDKDMVDTVQAKLHKALGLALQDAEPQQALEHFRQAQACYSGASVKRLITRLEKRLTEDKAD